MKIGLSGKRLSALLPSASIGGTVAAVRHLEAVGFDVRVLSSQRLSAAARSRYASRSNQNSQCAVDFAADSSDPTLGFFHALSEIYLGVKAFPRSPRLTPRTPSVQALAKTKKLP